MRIAVLTAMWYVQVLLFTATMPDSVAAQSKKWLRRAVRCRAKGEAAAQAISSTVVQVCDWSAILRCVICRCVGLMM